MCNGAPELSGSIRGITSHIRHGDQRGDEHDFGIVKGRCIGFMPRSAVDTTSRLVDSAIVDPIAHRHRSSSGMTLHWYSPGARRWMNNIAEVYQQGVSLMISVKTAIR